MTIVTMTFFNMSTVSECLLLNMVIWCQYRYYQGTVVRMSKEVIRDLEVHVVLSGK